MVYKCCVRKCKGNYPNTPKRALFSFPKDEALVKKWLKAINREHFIPSKYSKVCELHFNDTDIQTTASGFDQKNNKLITVQLQRSRLCPNAIPSILAKRQSSLTTTSTLKSNGDERKNITEMENIKLVVSSNITPKEEFAAGKKTFTSFETFLSCLEFEELPEQFTLVKKTNEVLFLMLKRDVAPQLSASVVVNENLMCSVYVHDIAVDSLGKHFFPKSISNTNELTDILTLVADTPPRGDNRNIAERLKKLLHSISNIDEEQHKTIDFLTEQVDLILCKKNQFRYSPNSSIFFCFLYSISPRAYNFLRNSSNIIVPHPRTLKKLCSTYDESPNDEQTSDDNDSRKKARK